MLIGRIKERNEETGGAAPLPPPAPPPDAAASSFFGESWIHEAGLSEASALEIYGVAIFVAFASITSSSSASIEPASALEYYLLTAANVLGSAVRLIR